MFRNLASLALSATLFLMSSAARAEWTDAVCSFADKEMLTSLHFENSKPTVERKELAGAAGSPATKLTMCRVLSTRDGVSRVLSIGSSPSPFGALGGGAMPANCSSQKTPSNFYVTTCIAVTKELMFTVTLMEKDDEEGKRLATVLSGHFKRRIKELNK